MAAASEEARRTLRYVEPLNEAKTKLTGFFSILLGHDIDSHERSPHDTGRGYYAHSLV